MTTSRSENGYGFWRPCLKTGVENNIFWSEIGSGFEEPDSTLPPRIPRSSPPRRCFLKSIFTYDYYLRCGVCDRRRKEFRRGGKRDNDWGEKQRHPSLLLLLLFFSTPFLPILRLPRSAREGGGYFRNL